MTRLPFGDVWAATLAAARRDAGTYATIAAAFVLLPAVAAEVLGAPTPHSLTAMDGRAVAIQAVLALSGGIAQLVIARLAMLGGTPRDALAKAGPGLLKLVGAALLSGLVLVPALALVQASMGGKPGLALPAAILLIPSIYVLARLSLSLPLIAARGLGPVAALRVSWGMTAGHGGRILTLLAIVLLLVLGLSLLLTAVAMALGTVLTAAGLKPLAGFALTLVSGAVAALYTVLGAVLTAEIAKRLG